MSLSRALATLALVLAVAIVAWLLFLRGSPGHEYTFVFENAGQLVRDNDVQVGGRRVGSIKDIELTDDNQAAITVEVEEPFAPLREGTEAVIRLTSLSGIANRYVALSMGPGDAPELDDGAVLGTNATTSVVDLDQLFNTLDERTRGSLQDVIQGFATQYEGKEAEAGEAAEYFNPLLSTSRRLVGELTEDEAALTRFIVDTGRLSSTLAGRRNELAALVGNTNATAQAIGSENVALSESLAVLPTTLRRANTTFVNLRATLDDLDVLVAESKPATKELAPFLRDLRPLLEEARPTIHDLALLVRRPGPNNDLVDATRGSAPAPARRHARLPQRPPGAPEAPARARVHPPVHAGDHRLAARLRPVRRQLRRQRPLRADPADLQRLPVHGQPGRRDAHAARPEPALRRH